MPRPYISNVLIWTVDRDRQLWATISKSSPKSVFWTISHEKRMRGTKIQMTGYVFESALAGNMASAAEMA